MRFETYKQMTEDIESREQYLLQRFNDLLEQIERLKAIDTMGAPWLQLEVSRAIERAYHVLNELF